MLNIIMRHKEEVVESCEQGKLLYRLFCTAAVAMETVAVATIAIIVTCVVLGI